MTPSLPFTDAAPAEARCLSLDNRYIAPAFITCILLVGHMSFGMLESYQKTLLAIVDGHRCSRWSSGASSSTSGCIRPALTSPASASAFWCVRPLSGLTRYARAISIMSKYVLRVKGRHIWNPSNFGISVLLFLAPEAVATLSIQWGNYLLPMLVIWVLGSVIISRAEALPHHSDLRRVIHRLRLHAKLDDGKSLAVGDRSAHRPDVPAVHLLHDHRSEDNGEIEDRAMRSGVHGGVSRDGIANASDRVCALLCVIHGRADCAADRDVDGIPAGDCSEA